MYSIATRRWFFPGLLALMLLAELLVLRATWATDTQADSKLRKLQVRSGYELLLENPASKDAQPILSYNATSQHDHRVAVDIHNGRLSPESQRLLAVLHPPANSGRLIYGRDPSVASEAGPPCLTALTIEFPPQLKMQARSVEIAPAAAEDVFDPYTTRLLHLVSKSPLVVRFSANSRDGANGPACRNLLSIASWQQVIGKDLELAFTVEPGSLVDLTLSSPSFASGKDVIESLEIEPLRPQRLATGPSGLRRVIQSRVFAGTPPLTITDLQLGGDFFDVELTGKAGIPIPELLGWTKWPLLAVLDLPLLGLAIQVFLLKNTIFLSYSWADRDRVMPIYERMKQAGLNPWIDHEQLRGGVDWEERIRREMLKCRRIVIFLSQSLNDGGFLLAELGLARAIADNRSKRSPFLIPVKLEKCPVPPILSQWNAIAFFEPEGERRLFEDLGVRTAPALNQGRKRTELRDLDNRAAGAGRGT